MKNHSYIMIKGQADLTGQPGNYGPGGITPLIPDRLPTGFSQTNYRQQQKYHRPGPKFQGGFSLLECLVSLSLSLLILISALEFSVQARKAFFRLKEAQERSLAAAVALEKIREDLETAGAGIPDLPSDDYFRPLQANGQTLVIFSAEERSVLLSDADAGQDYLLVELKPGFSSTLKKGRSIFLSDGNSGMLTSITAISGNRLVISPALETSFPSGRTQITVLEKIELYLDAQQKILRRRVNSTSGQPLIEEVTAFQTAYLPSQNLAKIILTSESGGQYHDYELLIYPKNLRKN